MADSKWGRWYVQATTPNGAELQTNDMWLNTSTGESHRYTGSALALTNGAWPGTLPALAVAAFASAGTTGTLPLILLEN